VFYSMRRFVLTILYLLLALVKSSFRCLVVESHFSSGDSPYWYISLSPILLSPCVRNSCMVSLPRSVKSGFCASIFNLMPHLHRRLIGFFDLILRLPVVEDACPAWLFFRQTFVLPTLRPPAHVRLRPFHSPLGGEVSPLSSFPL